MAHNIDIVDSDIKKNEIIKYLGEAIFPLKNKNVIEKFGEKVLELVADGYIVTSRSKIGIHPTLMHKIKGYMELSNKGWDSYEKAKTLSPKK